MSGDGKAEELQQNKGEGKFSLIAKRNPSEAGCGKIPWVHIVGNIPVGVGIHREKMQEKSDAINTAVRHHVAPLVDALEEIQKGEGEFSLDHLTHANNTIENMKSIAKKALENYKRRMSHQADNRPEVNKLFRRAHDHTFNIANFPEAIKIYNEIITNRKSGKKRT